MIRKLAVLAFICFSDLLHAETYLVSGTYKSDLGVDVVISRSKPQTITIDTLGKCVDTLKIKANVSYSGASGEHGACIVQATAEDDIGVATMRLITSGCRERCTVSGVYKHVAYNAPEPSVEIKPKECFVTIHPANPGTAVKINNEFFGVFSKPTRINISDFARYEENKKQCVALSSTQIVGSPSRQSGFCNSVISIKQGERFPNNILLDTDLCPSDRTLNLNIN